MEALVLETNFIKQYRPPYNVLMRDDKNYLYVKIPLNEDYPSIELVRRLDKDNAQYFGPFINTAPLRKTLKTLKVLFGYRTCRANQGKPCLDYHLGRCRGVCFGRISPAEYERQVTLPIINFFKGNHNEIVKTLKKEMEILATKKMFERAAAMRDKIIAISEINQRQTITQANTRANLDVIGKFTKVGKTVVQLFHIRLGKLLHQEQIILSDKLASQNIGSFIAQYYKESADYPKEIVLAQKLEDQEVVETWLTKLAGHKIAITIPSRGFKKQLLKLATENARSFLGQSLSQTLLA